MINATLEIKFIHLVNAYFITVLLYWSLGLEVGLDIFLHEDLRLLTTTSMIKQQ